MRLLADVASIAAMMLASCGMVEGEGTSTSPGPTSCAQLVRRCEPTRLPDVTLIHGQTSGAFGSVDGMDLTGIISFDEALRRAAGYAIPPDAQTVQVTLGSANAADLHWGKGTNLYYDVDWGGMCTPVAGPSLPPGGSLPSCAGSSLVTGMDAQTGEFIVTGGS